MPVPLLTEWSWILGACLLLNLSFASDQRVTSVRGGLGLDGVQYYAMARQIPRELPPKAATPFVYRLGTPFLAAALAKSQDWVIAAGFDRVNFAANLLTISLLTVWLRRHVASAFARVLVVIFFMVEPHSPMRFAYYYPVYVDPAAITFLMAGLLGLDWFELRRGFPRAAGITLLVAVGVAFREVVLVVGIAMLFVKHDGWADRLKSCAWLPLVTGTAVFAAIQVWTGVDAGAGEVRRWLTEKTLLQLVLAWFLVFGPLLIVPIYYARASLRLLVQHPGWLAYLAVLAPLAWVGGSDTERLIVFASPVVYLLIANGLALTGLGATSPIAVGLVVAQLISSRLFLPIEGPLASAVVESQEWTRLPSALTWLARYDSLWTQFCGPAALHAYAVSYGLISLGMVVILHYVTRRQVLQK